MPSIDTCFYGTPERQYIVRQKCGGQVVFGVKGFFVRGPVQESQKPDFLLCHEHKKWWNKMAASSSQTLSMPTARRVL
jgi:hypothetical protein